MMTFIYELDQEYSLAKAGGCSYLDMIQEFWLLDAANLSENDEKFVFTAVDFEKGVIFFVPF